MLCKSGGVAIAATPLTTLANTGTLPPEFNMYLASLFIVMPGITLFAMARTVIAWRKGSLGGLWVVAVFAATAFGGIWLWTLPADPKPLTLSTWPTIYLALTPVLGIWVASAWIRKRDAR